MKTLVIHISGPSGSGKTTMGNKLKKMFKNKINVLDLDDVFYDFQKQNNLKWGAKFAKKRYQTFINETIESKLKRKKILIVVGLNQDMDHHSGYYKIPADYKFYIKIPVDVVVRRKFDRAIDSCFGDAFKTIKNDLFQDLLRDEKGTIENMLQNFQMNFLLSKIKKDTEKWNRDYKEMDYQFVEPTKLLKKVTNLIKEFST